MFFGVFDAFFVLELWSRVKMYIFDSLLLFINWKRPLKSQKNSKFIKEQEVLTNWTIDGA